VVRAGCRTICISEQSSSPGDDQARDGSPACVGFDHHSEEASGGSEKGSPLVVVRACNKHEEWCILRAFEVWGGVRYLVQIHTIAPLLSRLFLQIHGVDVLGRMGST
jgi:hypothetical protein